MCSNVGNASSGVMGDHDHDHESCSLRKAKKQRIPKRGPGVAELEKILREQEKKGSTSTIIPNTYPQSKSLPTNVTLLPHHNHLGNTTPSTTPLMTLHVNGNGDLKGSSQLGGNGRSKGVYIGGSGVFVPEQTLLPITWGSSETRKEDETPKMATDFSFPLLLSNGSHHSKIFPPMQQNNHGSMMIGAKRPRTNFPVDNLSLAHPHMAFHQPPPIHPQISRLDPPSSSSNHGVFNLRTSSRDPMPSSPLELQVKTCANNDHVNPSGNDSALKLGSPTTPLPSTQHCQPDHISKFIKQLPFQEMKENTEGLLQRSSSGISEVSVPNKSFFSFLLPPEELKGAAEATLGLKNEKFYTEKAGDFIDLNLRL
ncbi:hypothetical protein PTKIN_Ptkin01aG0109600 [Pterospermum kingtungense]